MISIPDRVVFGVFGAKAREFLSGICTQQIDTIRNWRYALFLNPRGKVMFDARIWIRKDVDDDVDRKEGFKIDVAFAVQNEFKEHFKKFDLRNEVDLQIMNHLKVATSLKNPGNYSLEEEERNPVQNDDKKTNDWNWERVINRGIPQAGSDFKPGDYFPMEIGGDLIGAVAREKGCYLGQEMVARAFRLGISRKRLLPYRGDGRGGGLTALQVGQSIFSSKDPWNHHALGKITSVYKGKNGEYFGFALIDVSMTQEVMNVGEKLQNDISIVNPLSADLKIKEEVEVGYLQLSYFRPNLDNQ